MLSNNTFTIIKKEAIKTVLFISKIRAYFLFKIPIKFNSTFIQLVTNKNIILSYTTYIKGMW